MIMNEEVRDSFGVGAIVHDFTIALHFFMWEIVLEKCKLESEIKKLN